MTSGNRRPVLIGLPKQAKVKTIIGDLLLEISDGSVAATNRSFEQSEIACDCVATVAGSGPYTRLLEELHGNVEGLDAALHTVNHVLSFAC